MPTPLGYNALIDRYQLRTLPLGQAAMLDTGIKGRQLRQQGGEQIALFEPSYQPEDTLTGHLQFALRYEGVNLQVLALLFDRIDNQELIAWLSGTPESRYARAACFLYEWLSDKTLPIEDPVPGRAKYINVANPELQIVDPLPSTEGRFRVRNNLLGSRNFAPLIRQTANLQTMMEKELGKLVTNTLSQYDEDLLRRAAAYIYFKETQSSFEVEREKPSPDKARRFTDLLKQADTHEELTQDRLVELQQAVLDPRFHEFTWRSKQNWVGKDHGYRKLIDFVPPRPEDVPPLMEGLLQLASSYPRSGKDAKMFYPDPVILAAALAFGFVYIHPFMDGNGRIHRYLIHDVLSKLGFTPRGIVLPVSAVILAKLEEYISTLEHFSRPLNSMTEYDPAVPQVPATGNDRVYFKYPDLTVQAEFLYKALEHTVTHDLRDEIEYLLGFDTAYEKLNNLLDWPAHSLELFIRVVKENGGSLSATKHKSHFGWLQDSEKTTSESIVRKSFNLEHVN